MDEDALKQQWEKTLRSPDAWAAGDPGATYKPPTEATVIVPTEAAAPSPIAQGFDFIEEIGRGGMGVVYRARQGSLQREVAVKRILPDAKDPEAEAMFVSEALVTGGLDHPNIVPVHELARGGAGEVLLAMKLVSGRPWARLLHPATDEEKKAAAGYDTQRHIGVLLSVSNAVAFAHSKGIVHRDLKPENVMVGEFGEVLVMDWGLAVDVSSDPARARAPHKSTIHAPAGTPSYMPPELAQGRGESIGPWTDTYLLGAMLHEVVTGGAPHRGKTLAEVLRAAVRSAAPEYPPEVPSELQAICTKAMWQQPEARYQDVAEFRDAVEGYLRHRESIVISTAAEGALSRCAREARGAERNRLYAAFAEAVAGFRQARVLWGGNAAAIEGERRALLAYAGAALAQGDLGLAEAQAAALDAADAEGAALRRRIEDARAAQGRAARNTRLLRRSLVGATVLIVAGLIVGILAVKAEQRRTLEQKDRATERLALSYVSRARQYEEVGDDPAAALYYAEACVTHPTHLTQACAALALRRLCRLRAILPHDWPVQNAVFSPDGSRVATADSEKTARIWDAATGAQIREVQWPRGEMADVAFSPDGKRFATAACGSGQVWDADTGARIGAELAHSDEGEDKPVFRVAFSPDGGRVATGSEDTTARLWDARTGAPIGEPMRHLGAVRGVAFSPDGQRLLTAACDGIARLWDLRTGGLLPRDMRHDARVNRAVFSPSGRRILTVGGDNIARVWNAETGAAIGVGLRHEEEVLAGAFSPDGTLVLTAGKDHTARLWYPDSRAPLGRVMHHNGAVRDVAFTPDGGWVVTASADGTARVWNTDGEPLGGVMRHDGEVARVAVSPDGRTVATASQDHTARLWDLATDRPLCTGRMFVGRISGLFFLPDGTCVAVQKGDNAELNFWDARTGKELRGEGLPSAWSPAGRVSPDGRRKVIEVPPYSVQVVDAATGAPIGKAMRHGEVVKGVAFSPDGRTVATGGLDQTVRLWDAETGEPLGGPLRHNSGVSCVAFSLDGRWLAAADYEHEHSEGAVRLWDVAALIDSTPAGELLLRAQVDTGFRLDDRGELRAIPPKEWRPLKER